MTRSELEHLIRAAGAISGDHELVIIGSQSVLGQHPDAPRILRASMEADLYPRNHPERADLVDGAIGEGSRFHEEYGYYAQGVGERTAKLPRGWQDRLIPVSNENTGGTVGLCLEVHDLAVSKYAAGREKDLAFTAALARHGLTRKPVLLDRAGRTPLPAALRDLVLSRVARDFAMGRRRGRRG
jgi:hypothetical protein